MINTKKKQKQIVESFRKDTELVKDYLVQLGTEHKDKFSEEERQALASIDRYFVNLDTWLAGLEKGLKG